MKNLINRLICLIRGHEWYVKVVGDIRVGHDYKEEIIYKCTRCGKTKEVVI